MKSTNVFNVNPGNQGSPIFFMVLFTKEYLPTSVLCCLLMNFSYHERPYSGSMIFAGYPLSLYKPVSRCMPCEGRTIGLSFYAVPKSPNQINLYNLQIYPRFFVTDLKRLPDLLCMGPNILHHIQVSVSLVTHKPDVSSYYFPVCLYPLLNEGTSRR
jgi:hypothetical protein